MKQSRDTESPPKKTGLGVKRVVTDFCGPDKEYVPFHAFFFTFFGGFGALLPFLSLYFKQLGLSAAQAGVLSGIRPLSEGLSPFWGWIGDKYKKRKIILQLALISYTLGILVTLAVQPEHQRCVENEGGNKTYSTTLEFSFGSGVSLGHETSAMVDNTKRNNSAKYQREVNQAELNNMFAIILLITVLGQIVGGVVFTFPEVLTVAFLDDKANKFGGVRFLGEVSVSTSSLAVGAALYETETEICGLKFKNYSLAFYCLAAWMAVALITTIWMKTKYHDSRPNIYLREVVRSVANLKSISLLVVSVFLGLFQGMHETYGLWFLDELGGSSLLVGVAVGVRCIFSTLGYIISQYFIGYFGVLRPLIVAMLSYSVVFCGFSLMHIPGVALVFFVLQGGLYGLSWCTMVAHVGSISQDTGYTASIQGVYSGTFWGLGYGGGAMLSGVLVQVLGIRITYQSFATVAVFLCFLLISVYWLTEGREDGKDNARYGLIGEDKRQEDEASDKEDEGDWLL